MPALHPSAAVDPEGVARPARRPILRLQPALPAPAPIRNGRAALLILGGLALVTAVMFLWWPAGVVVGLVLGLGLVFALGGAQQRAAGEVPLDDDLAGLFGEPEAPAATSASAVPVEPVALTAVPNRLSTALLPEREPAPVLALPAPEQAAIEAPVRAAAPAAAHPDGVRADLSRLKADLGDDWPDFARAARLVVSTQYASAARLQRDLQLPYSRARRLLADLESEHFVGPATGTLPRQVLVQKERLPEVERLFAGV